MKRRLIVALASAFLTGCGSADVSQDAVPAQAVEGTSIAQLSPASPPPAEGRAPSPPARVAGRTSLDTASNSQLPSTTTRSTSVYTPEYREVVLPAGTALALALATPVASDQSQVEDSVRATLRDEVTLDNETILPAGTELRGRVTEVERAGRVKGRARVAMRFTILTHEGDEYDVRSEAIERIADATKGEDAAKIGIGAGAGAALGAILGGGSGAARGAAIGAAAGTGTVLATRGDDVRLEAGEPLDTRLTSSLPLRIRIPSDQ